jgi:hypothetical protein
MNWIGSHFKISDEDQEKRRIIERDLILEDETTLIHTKRLTTITKIIF